MIFYALRIGSPLSKRQTPAKSNVKRRGLFGGSYGQAQSFMRPLGIDVCIMMTPELPIADHLSFN